MLSHLQGRRRKHRHLLMCVRGTETEITVFILTDVKISNLTCRLVSAVKPPMKRPKNVEYPCTPPPSPRISGSPAGMYREDNLVHINMMLVDKDAPNFISHYEGVRISHDSIFILINVFIINNDLRIFFTRDVDNFNLSFNIEH